MKSITLKPIEIGYEDEKIIIYPRMVSVAEELEVTEQLNSFPDDEFEKWETQYQVCLNALEKFSEKPAEKYEKVKGVLKRVPIEGGLVNYFKERTNSNERIVRDAYRMMMRQMSPNARFTTHSE